MRRKTSPFPVNIGHLTMWTSHWRWWLYLKVLILGDGGHWNCCWIWRWLFSLGLQIKGSSSFWYLLTHGERFQPTRALIKHWTQLASNTNDCNSESESRKWKLDYPLLLRHLWTPPCWAKAPRLANLPTCLVALTFRAETPPIDDDCWLLFVCWTPPPWLPLLDAPWDDD